MALNDSVGTTGFTAYDSCASHCPEPQRQSGSSTALVSRDELSKGQDAAFSERGSKASQCRLRLKDCLFKWDLQKAGCSSKGNEQAAKMPTLSQWKGREEEHRISGRLFQRAVLS